MRGTIRRRFGAGLQALLAVLAAALPLADAAPVSAAAPSAWRGLTEPLARSNRLVKSTGATRHNIATATAVSVDGNEKRTTFRLSLSFGVTAEIFTLANPYRVIVDLPDVAFALPEGSGQKNAGLVKSFRYGLFAERKARIVIDTNGPVRVENASMTAIDGSENAVMFAFDVVATAAQSFGQGTGAKRGAGAPSPVPPDPFGSARPKPRDKPVVMLDPGHGGIDGGAVGVTSVLEKEIVLAVAKQVRSALEATGRYEVRMTRETDVFISLDQRLALSAESGAELFISLHADSLGEQGAASSVRGATVYTLSEQASDEQARLMAEKENASDIVAGLDVREGPASDQVRNILIDLLKRETANFSADFSNILVRELRRKVNLSRAPQRSAAFKVLKQTHSPSVLVELGYLSNLEDERLLRTAEWQRKAAASITAAVESFFSSRVSSSP